MSTALAARGLGRNGRAGKPDEKKLGVELRKLKHILVNKDSSLLERQQARERLCEINMKTDPAREVYM